MAARLRGIWGWTWLIEMVLIEVWLIAFEGWIVFWAMAVLVFLVCRPLEVVGIRPQHDLTHPLCLPQLALYEHDWLGD